MELILNSNKIQKILKKGLDCNQYITLILLKNNEIDLATQTHGGFIKMLIAGWLHTSHSLTPKSVKLIQELEGKTEKKEEILNNYQQLYILLQEKMLLLTGKKQKLISGKYYFMPTYVDFARKLGGVVKKYELKDWNKLENVLINYVIRAKKSNFEMIQLLGYYIEKNNSSTLATDYENYVEGQKDESKQVFAKQVENDKFEL